MAGANRKWATPDVDADEKATAPKTKWGKLEPNSTTFARFMPSVYPETKKSFTTVVNHFNLKNAEGGDIAPACLDDIKGEYCPACAAAKKLFGKKDKVSEAIAKKLNGRPRHYAEYYVKGREDEGPKLIGFAPSMVKDLNVCGKTLRDGKMPAYNDPKKGQWIALRRDGSGFDTEYAANITGDPVDLYKLRPNWEDELTYDVMEAINPRILTAEEMVDAMKKAFGGEVDFDSLLG